MTIFDSHEHADVIYLKVKGEKDLWSIPFNEVFEGAIDSENTNEQKVGLDYQKKDKKTKVEFTRGEFLDVLNHKLADVGVKATDFALLADGETNTTEVTMFIEKYR